MNTTDILSRAPGLAQRMFEGRMLVITASDSILHRFNEVGTFIWGLLETPRSAEEITAAVSTHFDGFDAATGEKEIREFITMLLKKNLIQTKHS